MCKNLSINSNRKFQVIKQFKVYKSIRNSWNCDRNLSSTFRWCSRHATKKLIIFIWEIQPVATECCMDPSIDGIVALSLFSSLQAKSWNKNVLHGKSNGKTTWKSFCRWRRCEIIDPFATPRQCTCAVHP